MPTGKSPDIPGSVLAATPSHLPTHLPYLFCPSLPSPTSCHTLPPAFLSPLRALPSASSLRPPLPPLITPPHTPHSSHVYYTFSAMSAYFFKVISVLTSCPLPPDSPNILPPTLHFSLTSRLSLPYVCYPMSNDMSRIL